ncbi:hypothetical protein CN305_15660 [Bacillus cereus]|nr:hypothetical protein CON43_28015 [Bacillus cereus]PEW63305.1 hypothetical protein CN443_08235 [Bacillus cereus]PEY86627.1 hypothetical protein CN353_29440 [Bacillus cereus]PFD18194.1 hypothetical protein CN305_15660 [Bacillus cereus]PFL98040.1 hypothetical protein COJ39_31025 [Bacillus cereus]
MEFLQQLLQDATKLFVTVFITTFATACANKLVAKRNNKSKRTTQTSVNRTQFVRHLLTIGGAVLLCLENIHLR